VFFTVYVFFQVWNEINCRSLTPRQSGIHGLHRNPVLLVVISLIVLGQVLIVTLGGKIFEVQALGPVTWLAIAIGTATVLVHAEVVRRVRRGASRP
jgi:Ca2+-transporting ATPase